MNKLNHELSLSIADPRFWSQDHTLPTKLVLLWKKELGYRSIISSFKITQDYFALQHFIHYMLISNQVLVWMRYRERGNYVQPYLPDTCRLSPDSCQYHPSGIPKPFNNHLWFDQVMQVFNWYCKFFKGSKKREKSDYFAYERETVA